jgi:hypothetical protein
MIVGRIRLIVAGRPRIGKGLTVNSSHGVLVAVA